MRALFLSGVALAAMSLGSARAADLPIKAPRMAVAAAPVWNWSGSYIGVHGGYGWASPDYAFPDAGGVGAFGPNLGGAFGFNHDADGGVAGFHSGYNWQFGNWLFGIEGMRTWLGMKGRTGAVLAAFPNATYETKLEWVSTFTPRLGFAVGNWLVYAKGGFAYAHAESRLDNPTFATGHATFREKTDYSGWTAGLGVEFALTSNWILGVEYNYYNFGAERFGGLVLVNGAAAGTGPDYNIDLTASAVVARLSYKSGGFNPIISAILGVSPDVAPGPWTGFYAGIHGGYGFGDSRYAFPGNGGFAALVAPAVGLTYDSDADGGIFGGHIGYTRQIGNWVLGTEGSLSWAGLKGSHTLGLAGLNAAVLAVSNSTELEWLATATTRFGYSFGPWLAYAKGGAAIGSVRSSFVVNTTGLGTLSFAERNDHAGWTLGAGVEYGWSNWVVGLEYSYIDLGKEQYGGLMIPNNFASGGQYEADLAFSSVLARISYRFGGPAPVSARY